jgi:hypothetical protein
MGGSSNVSAEACQTLTAAINTSMRHLKVKLLSNIADKKSITKNVEFPTRRKPDGTRTVY